MILIYGLRSCTVFAVGSALQSTNFQEWHVLRKRIASFLDSVIASDDVGDPGTLFRQLSHGHGIPSRSMINGAVISETDSLTASANRISNPTICVLSRW